MEDITKEYSKDDLTVVWQPKKCIHSANCWRGLPKAFNPKERPWITLDNVTSAEILEQVLKCPSGALSIKSENDSMKNNEDSKQCRNYYFEKWTFADKRKFVHQTQRRKRRIAKRSLSLSLRTI
jgi:uncharacterized Fe-S cluster protein YjdI